MRKALLFIVALTMIICYTIKAQVAVTTDGSDPDASAILDVKSTDKGFLFPRLTQSEIAAITNPSNGLTVFNTDDNHFYFYDDGAGEWKEIAIGAGTITPVWTCGNTLYDTRDGQSYATVQIGIQCWMAENLNIGTRIDVSLDQTQNTPTEIIEKYCYNNSTSNCDTYGGLYQWDEMMQYVATEGVQGICPVGWHLPTDDEYKTLEMQLGMTQTQADATGYRGNAQGSSLAGNEPLWVDGNLDQSTAFGLSGFDALPGGSRLTSGEFEFMNYNAYFWSSSESVNSAWRRTLNYYYHRVYRSTLIKEHGFSVRCLRN